jgi:hypothetical protein
LAQAGLADLVRREVLTVSADPLSPERGSYQFAQQMLRQVAYDTLSRRDRKASHLAVAQHLRQAYAGDGEEVADVIARHYRDALDAVPDDADIAEIRGQAIAALVRAADRASRAGAPAAAAASYSAAADLSVQRGPEGSPDGLPAGGLWESAAGAASIVGAYSDAVVYADRARQFHQQHGQARAAARAQAIIANALRRQGRHGEAREQFAAALAILRADPDTDTVVALSGLANLEVFAGSADADGLSAEALALGQALGVGDAMLADLLITRAICHCKAERRAQGAAYFREAARIATEAADNQRAGRALANLADVLCASKPAVAAEAARAATVHLRQAGARALLGAAAANLAQALLMLGDWDAADAELTHGAEASGLTDTEVVGTFRAWLAALRGDADGALETLAGLAGVLASEDPQDQAEAALVRALSSVAASQPAEALRHARVVLALADALGMGADTERWAWPLAARAAHDLADTAVSAELLAQLDLSQPGHLAPMLRAERDLVRARLAALGGDLAAAPAFAAAIRGLRELSTPYHLAHGLLDHADYLARSDSDGAAAAIAEASDIAARLGCQPLLDRAASLAGASRLLA